MSLLDFVDKIMEESLRACFLDLPLLYMGVTPLVSHLYNYLEYSSNIKKNKEKENLYLAWRNCELI